eukprot:3790759-Prymnesium_polylepis.1
MARLRGTPVVQQQRRHVVLPPTAGRSRTSGQLAGSKRASRLGVGIAAEARPRDRPPSPPGAPRGRGAAAGASRRAACCRPPGWRVTARVGVKTCLGSLAAAEHNHSGQSLNHSGQPLNHSGQPLNHSGQPLNHSGQSLNHSGQSLNHPGQSLNHAGRRSGVRAPCGGAAWRVGCVCCASAAATVPPWMGWGACARAPPASPRA